MFSILKAAWRNNSDFKVVVLCSFGIILLMILFPPYELTNISSGKVIENGYKFLFSMAERPNWRNVIDYPRLFLQFTGVFILSTFYLLVKNSFKNLSTINNSSKKDKSGIDFSKVEFDKTIYNLINKDEEKLFEFAMLEIENQEAQQGLLAKCLSETLGDEQKAKALYITYRVNQLKSEQNEQVNKLTNYLISVKAAYADACPLCKNNNVYIDVHNRPFCPDCERYLST